MVAPLRICEGLSTGLGVRGGAAGVGMHVASDQVGRCVACRAFQSGDYAAGGFVAGHAGFDVAGERAEREGALAVGEVIEELGETGSPSSRPSGSRPTQAPKPDLPTAATRGVG